MKILCYSFLFIFAISKLWALKIQEPNFPLPKVTYSGLNDIGLDDTQERATKQSLRELLLDPDIAPSLKSRTDVDSRAYSLVQEIQLEKKNWNLRLLKSKARMALIDFTRQHWTELSRSTVNHSGSNDYKQFLGLLKRDLMTKFYIESHSDQFIVFNMKWAKIRVDRTMKNAYIVVQQDYLGDSNDLTDTAYLVKPDPKEVKPKKKKTASEKRDNGIPKTGIFAF